MILAQLFRILLLGQKPELEIVASEAIDAVDEILQRGQVIPWVRGGGGRAFNALRPRNGTLGSLGSGPWMAVVAITVRLATRGKDAMSRLY